MRFGHTEGHETTHIAHSLGNMVVSSVVQDSLDVGHYAWHKQEMGWGFEVFGHWTNGTPPMYELGDPALPYVAPVRMHTYTIQQALAAPNDQLRADPVFNHEPPEILSGNLQTGDIDILLARGVPALSNPMGSGSAQEISGVNAQDLDEYSSDQNWPHVLEPKWKGWWHSDIKDVAFPFVRDVFDLLKGDNTP